VFLTWVLSSDDSLGQVAPTRHLLKEPSHMNKIKVTVVTLATAGIGLVGVNTAFAGSHLTTPKAPAVSPATDGDNVQQGDQTTPDVPGAVEAPEATSTKVGAQSMPLSANSAPAKSASVRSAADHPVTEAPDAKEGASGSGASESSASDGNDGGHADPEGVDVNHEGGAGEK
jgi:hypothetical protein